MPLLRVLIAQIVVLLTLGSEPQVVSQLQIYHQPLLDPVNPIWDKVREIIVKWLPKFMETLPYPDEDIRKGNVHVQSYDTQCLQFQIQDEDLNLDLTPGFPKIQANIKAVVPYAEYSSGIDWSLYRCIWKFTCFGKGDTVYADLYDFTLDLNVTMDIDPFDKAPKTPEIESAFIELTTMKLRIKAHWYSQWMYDTIMKLYGKEIDDKATTALNAYLEQQIKIKGWGGVATPDFFQGDLGEQLQQLSLDYRKLSAQESKTSAVEM